MRLQVSFAVQALLTGCLLFCPVAWAQDSAEATLNRARTAYRQRDYAEAKRELQLAQAARKDWPEAMLLGALIAWQEGQRNEAIKQAKSAVKLQAEFPTAHYLLGKLLFEDAKYDDAFQSVETAMRQGQQFADIYVLLGDIEIIRHKPKEALMAYNTALQQPAPKNELNEAFQLRREAVRNLIEFLEHKGDARYQRPVLIRDSLQAAQRVGGVGKVNLAGILDTQGQYVDVLLLSADVGLKGKEEMLLAARQIKFNPALKDGKPVPFWLYFSYERGTSVTRW